MLGHFYNQSIRKYVILISNLFSNVQVSRDRGLMPVPVTYASKERFLAKLNHMQQDASMARVETILPRISFNLVNMVYDGTRKTNVANRKLQRGNNDSRPKLNSQFNGVPFDFEFEMGIWTRHQDDIFQIIEQILPYFQPQFVCQMKELDKNELVIDKRDIPITIESIQMEEDLEGDATDRRRIEWTLNLRLKGWLYPGSDQSFGEIRTIYLDFNDEEREIIHAERVSMNSQLGIDYSIRASIAESNQLNWVGRMVMPLDINHDIREKIAGPLELQYKVQGSVSGQSQLNYQLRSSVSGQNIVPWNRITVDNQLEIQYSIMSDGGQPRVEVSSQLGLEYDTRTLVAGQLGLEYDTRTLVDGQLGLEYDTRTSVDGQLGLEYDTRTSVDGQLGLEYDISPSVVPSGFNNWQSFNQWS